MTEDLHKKILGTMFFLDSFFGTKRKIMIFSALCIKDTWDSTTQLGKFLDLPAGNITPTLMEYERMLILERLGEKFRLHPRLQKFKDIYTLFFESMGVLAGYNCLFADETNNIEKK